MTIGGTDDGGRLRFVLPSFPVSVNRLYVINHNQRRVLLSDDALIWRTRTSPLVKACRWPEDWSLKLTLEYESPDWYFKNGKLRKLDVQNLEKLLIDTLFAKWGWDDSRLVEKVSCKRWGPREQIVVTLEQSKLSLSAPTASAPTGEL